MANAFDRSSEDLGNIVALEHVNVSAPDQRLSTLFYIVGMGFTRDPYTSTGVTNMWINVGGSQFHVGTSAPQVVRGHVGIVIPDREALLARLIEVKAELDGTKFNVEERDDFVDVTSPWGLQLRCYEPRPDLGPITLGIPYVEFDVPSGTGEGIAAFYRGILGGFAETGKDGGGLFAKCAVGHLQYLIFRETDRELPEYDGHHVQVYVANFSSPHEELSRRGLLTEESNQWQYRFCDIVDPKDDTVLYSLEHEVRAMTHPLFRRQLVNRDASQPLMDRTAGDEDFRWVQGRR